MTWGTHFKFSQVCCDFYFLYIWGLPFSQWITLDSPFRPPVICESLSRSTTTVAWISLKFLAVLLLAPNSTTAVSVSCNINFPWSFTTYFLRSLVSDSTLDIKSSHHHSLSCSDRTTMLELGVVNRDQPLMSQIPTFLTEFR